jgi:hypothetical protein
VADGPAENQREGGEGAKDMKIGFGATADEKSDRLPWIR